MRSAQVARSLIGLTLLPFAGLLLGCGAGGQSGRGENPKLSLIVIAPADPHMAKGTSLQLSATGSYDDGTKRVLTSAAWQTSQSAVATINTQGFITAVGQGAAQVSASYQGVTGSTSITVGAPALGSIAVTPAQSSLPSGEVEQMTATGSFSDGTTKDLTQSVTWSSTGPGIASVSATGSADANAVGSVTITASAGSVNGSASLTVTPAVVVSLNIAPAILSIVVEGHRQLQATATWSDGTVQDVTGIAGWSSTQVGIATVSSGGMVTAEQVGSTTILAQSSNLTASANLTVAPLMLLNYFDRTSAEKSGIDGTVRLINPGVTFGNLCAMVYVLDQDQALNECCGCTVSDSGLLSLSLLHDLTSNPLTGKKSHAGTIKVVPSDIGQNPQCDPSSLSPTGVLLGWETNVQPQSNSSTQVTETGFELVALSDGSATKMANECGFIEQSGGGQGICSCGSGK